VTGYDNLLDVRECALVSVIIYKLVQDFEAGNSSIGRGVNVVMAVCPVVLVPYKGVRGRC
jgi:hypothetical protein